VQTALKAVNSVVGLAGMAVILYALWMLRAWYREVNDLDQRFPVPWSATASPSNPPPPASADLALRSCFCARAARS
jgi:hypothetical protein